MNPHKYQPPIIDLNNLDDNHEIRFEYDENGNLTRIRKVNRYESFSASILVVVLIGLVLGLWQFLGG
jgi:hypothetical protein